MLTTGTLPGTGTPPSAGTPPGTDAGQVPPEGVGAPQQFFEQHLLRLGEYFVLYICNENKCSYLVAWEGYLDEPSWEPKAHIRERADSAVDRWNQHTAWVKANFPDTPPHLVLLRPETFIGCPRMAATPIGVELQARYGIQVDVTKRKCLAYAMANCLKLLGLRDASHQDFVHITTMETLRSDPVAARHLVLAKKANRRMLQRDFPLVSRRRGDTAFAAVSSALGYAQKRGVGLVFFVVAQPSGWTQHTPKHCLTVWAGGVLDPCAGFLDWEACAADWKGGVCFISPVHLAE